MGAVRYERAGSIAVLTVDHPPVNALAVSARGALGEALDRALQDADVDAVVLMGAGSTFVAGAEISEFGTPTAKVEPLLSSLQRRIATFPKLVVAAIHGTALGGGFEL